MLSHNGIDESSTRGLQPNSTPARRKRRATHSHSLGPDARSCPHCGRTFKRTEHLDRHVRTHTKEKPFICQCGAAFARRDLLTRHQRITLHEDASESPNGPSEPDSGEQHHGPVEADMAAAVSLSGMSVHHWSHQQAPAPAAELYPMAVSRNGTLVDDAPYQQGILAEPFYENGPLLALSNPIVMTIKEANQSQAIKMPWGLMPTSENSPAFSMALACLQNGALTSIALTETTRSSTQR